MCIRICFCFSVARVAGFTTVFPCFFVVLILILILVFLFFFSPNSLDKLRSNVLMTQVGSPGVSFEDQTGAYWRLKFITFVLFKS